MLTYLTETQCEALDNLLKVDEARLSLLQQLKQPPAQRSVLARVVNAITGLDISKQWGEGKTSSSDAQRYAYSRQTLQQTYSTKFRDFALEFYTFVADNYAPYFSLPIECTDRDSPYVMDGILYNDYNESDLVIEEHYVDSHVLPSQS